MQGNKLSCLLGFAVIDLTQNLLFTRRYRIVRS